MDEICSEKTQKKTFIKRKLELNFSVKRDSQYSIPFTLKIQAVETCLSRVEQIEDFFLSKKMIKNLKPTHFSRESQNISMWDQANKFRIFSREN